MKLTDFADYSLRVLIYAALRPGELVTVQEIASTFDIQRNHLVKVVNALSRSGYLTTVRGRAGGLRLALEPEEINVGEVIRSMEPDFHIVECFDDKNNQCLITAACGLRGILGGALEAYFDYLDGYTLADLLVQRRSLVRALNKEAPIHFVSRQKH
ncbi:Rrf2 family transcriptional regulator [Candidimonas nitroreducens]|uniref:Rrf2 family transcriptional regulator n=1 Tax=Candidimonas nitroreducens TaxID=683354 RepID=A0A225M203_9BURK|nr:Rrf2 family transcriptional regulator [Candidimonas nitroreducens]OWT55146.1 Rrf2 family transcriptional regulator [Candidimonas nitroreducens]